MTAGNSTPLSDGASAVLLATEEWAARARPAGARPASSTPRPQRSTHVSGKEGLLMAPAYAVPRLLARQGLTLQDFDFYEIHEAFAAQVLCTLAAWEDADFCRERLGLDGPLGSIDRAKLNVSGLARWPPGTRSRRPAAGSSATSPRCSPSAAPAAA